MGGVPQSHRKVPWSRELQATLGLPGRGYAGTLARLHAVATADDASTLPRWQGPGGRDVAAFLGLAAALGARVPSGVPGELDHLAARPQQDQGHALLHGDPVPRQ